MKDRALWLIFILSTPHLHLLEASQGIIIAVCDRYVDDLLISLNSLRNIIGSSLPIEIWHAGNELSLENQKRLSQFEALTIHDISEQFSYPPAHFRGFQIKGYLGIATSFDEFIIMDADLLFYQDPAKLFDHPEYQKTGAFFFSDQESYQFFGYPRVPGRLYHGGLDSYYRARKAFFRSLIATPSPYLPKKWHHYWEEISPTPIAPIPSEHQESGCVVIDKRKHKAGLEEIRKLNENYQTTYRYVWGDKETFWLGLEIVGEPYFVNTEIPFKIIDRPLYFCPWKIKKIALVQLVDGKLFYQQKKPCKLTKLARLVQRSQALPQTRRLTQEELALITAVSYCPAL